MSEYSPPLSKVLLTTIAFGALAVMAIELTRRSGGIALAWGGTGLLVAVMATIRPRQWIGLLLACFVVSFAATYALRLSLIAATGFAIANMMEALVIALTLRRFNAHRKMLNDANSVLIFALVGGLLGPAATLPLGCLTAWLAFGANPFLMASDWILAHGLGTLIVAPLALIALVPDLTEGRRRPSVRELARFSLTIAAVVAITTAVFAQNALPLLFLPALPVMVATVRLGRLGSAAALLAVGVVGGALTVAGHGPIQLAKATGAFRLQFFQLYLATLFLIALPTAALLARQRQLTKQLREREAALRLLADNSSDVLLSLDVHGGIRFASPSVRMLGGYDPAALVGRNALELVDPDFRGLVQRAHLDAIAAPDTSITVEYQARRRDGSIAWFETITRAIGDGDGGVTGVVSAIRDVGHRKAVERQLRLAADSDPLTGLPNRRPFVAALEEAIAGAGSQPATVAMLDLDYFKRVNDQYGHAAGDAVLIMIAELFQRELRGNDMVARLGGEEFAVLLRGIEFGAAEAACERLRLAISTQPILAHGTPIFRVTASFGLAEVRPGATGEAILESADRALYAAKNAGRNQLSIAA